MNGIQQITIYCAIPPTFLHWNKSPSVKQIRCIASYNFSGNRPQKYSHIFVFYLLQNRYVASFPVILALQIPAQVLSSFCCVLPAKQTGNTV